MRTVILPGADHAGVMFIKCNLMGMAKNRSKVSCERRTVMTKFGLMAVTALSLVMATPVMAMHGHHHHYGYYHALKHHFGSTYAAYGFYRGSDFARKNTFD
jgi:hypothetical protein